MFSKRHYQHVSPPADTKHDILDRQRRVQASILSMEDRIRRYPTLDATNIQEVLDYQQRRYQHHYAEASR